MNNTTKKFMSVFLALLMIVGFVPFVGIESVVSSAASVWDGSSTASPTQSGDYYYIDNAAQFAGFAKQVRDGTSYSGKTVYLQTDIDLQNKSFDGIGWDNQFAGTFDGQNHTVFNVSRDVSHDAFALFPRVNNAAIKNLTVDGITVKNTHGSGSTGALVGRVYNSVTVTDCHVKNANITGTKYTGGIIGELQSKGTVTNCSFEGKINASGSDCGGIIGICQSGADGTTVSGCTVGTESSKASITSSGSYTGGVIGDFYCDNTLTVKDCTVYADVKCTASSGGHTGGIIGYQKGHGTFSNCAFTGSVETTSSGNAGGIIGEIQDDENTVESCTVNAETISCSTSSNCHAGGIIGWAGGTTITHTVKDTVAAFEKVSGYDAAGIIGAINSSAVITNVKSLGGSITAGGRNAGGIVGWVNKYALTLTSCVNTASVTGSQHTGGIIGYGGEGVVSNLSRCFNYGDVTSSGSSQVGGIIGYTKWSSSSHGVIDESLNYGAVTGKVNAGGLVGEGQWAKVTNSFNKGSVTHSDSNKTCSVGGIGGANLQVENSFNTGNVSYGDYAAGIVAYNPGTVKNCYNTGSVSGANNTDAIAAQSNITTINDYYLNTGSSSRSNTTSVTADTLKASDMPAKLNSSVYCQDTWGINSYYPIHQWWRNNYFYFTITFDANGGSASGTSDGTYLYGKTLNAPEVTREGYIFSGWYTAASGGVAVSIAQKAQVTAGQTVGSNTCALTLKKDANTVNGSVTYYAHWTPVTYTVSYDGNGATDGSTASSTHTYDTAQALTANGYTREYDVTYNYNYDGAPAAGSDKATYTFNGWKRDGDEKTYSNSESVKNLTATQGDTVTMYAQWTADSVTLPTATRVGYTFAGWYADSECTENKEGDANDAYTPTENTTLYAKWTINSYTVTFANYDGEAVKTEEVNYGEKATAPAENPAKPYDETYHYEFSGWNGFTAETVVTEDVTYTAEYTSVAHTYSSEITTPSTCVKHGTTTYTCECGYSYTADDAEFVAHTPGDAVKENEVAATCTEDGSYDEVICCSVCTAELSRESKTVEATGHDFTNAVNDKKYLAEEATCGMSPLYYVSCTNCGESSKGTTAENKFTYGEPLGHNLEHHDAKNATCTADGNIEYYTCTRCEELFKDAEGKEAISSEDTVTKANGHTEVIDAAKPATCTETGLTEGKHCSVCNEVLVKQETVSALTHDWGEWIVTTAPTCTTLGVETRVCKNDASHTETQSIEKAAHVYSVFVETVTKATCKATGTDKYKCATCDETITKETPVDETNHVETQLINVKEATCTEEGYTGDKQCTACGVTVETGAATEKKDHVLTHHDAKAATCTAVGWNAYDECANCDYSTYVEIPVDVNAHDWGEWTVTDATCKQAGSKTRVCKNNNEHTETENIPVKEHAPVTVPGKESTCTETGLTDGKKCFVCNEVLVEQEVIPEKPHTPGEAVKENIKNATCTAEGSYDEVVYCTVCTAELSREPKTEEKIAHDFELVSDTAATCTQDGEKSYKCTRCDETKSEKIDATGHSWGEWVTVKEPTTTEEGLAKRTCSACGTEEEKTLDRVSEKNRIIQFVNIDKMHYVLDNDGEDYIVYNSGAVKWYSDKPLNFTVYTYSNFKYQTVIVKVDGIEISPNADGVYTVPAGENLAVVTVVGAVEDSDGTKISFWEMIIRFFKKIFSAIAGLFGGNSGSKN